VASRDASVWSHDKEPGRKMKPALGLPETLGSLRSHNKYGDRALAERPVKDELRENLICKLERKEPLFPGIVGYEDTVVPQVVNALHAHL